MNGLTVLAPAALLLLGLAGSVSAESMQSARPVQMEVVIGPKGNVKLAGTIASISGNTVMVTSWGGSWTVDATGAKFTRKAGGTSGLSEMKAGDRVMVNGSMQTSGFAVNAKVIHNESIHAIASNKVGTVSNLDATAGTFTLTTREGTALKVTTNADTKFWLGKASSTISALTGLSATSTVRVDGVINREAGTIIAQKVQIGLPMAGKPMPKPMMNKLERKLDR